MTGQQPLPAQQRQAAHGQGQPEYGAPAKVVDQIAADGRPQRWRNHHPQAVEAQGHAPAATHEYAKDQDHGQWLDDPGTQALDDAQGNQLPGLLGDQCQ
ncbi:hypothetical protein D9M70_646780 [compost metagenome]